MPYKKKSDTNAIVDSQHLIPLNESTLQVPIHESRRRSPRNVSPSGPGPPPTGGAEQESQLCSAKIDMPAKKSSATNKPGVSTKNQKVDSPEQSQPAPDIQQPTPPNASGPSLEEAGTTVSDLAVNAKRKGPGRPRGSFTGNNAGTGRGGAAELGDASTRRIDNAPVPNSEPQFSLPPANVPLPTYPADTKARTQHAGHDSRKPEHRQFDDQGNLRHRNTPIEFDGSTTQARKRPASQELERDHNGFRNSSKSTDEDPDQFLLDTVTSTQKSDFTDNEGHTASVNTIFTDSSTGAAAHQARQSVEPLDAIPPPVGLPQQDVYKRGRGRPSREPEEISLPEDVNSESSVGEPDVSAYIAPTARKSRSAKNRKKANAEPEEEEDDDSEVAVIAPFERLNEIPYEVNFLGKHHIILETFDAHDYDDAIKSWVFNTGTKVDPLQPPYFVYRTAAMTKSSATIIIRKKENFDKLVSDINKIEEEIYVAKTLGEKSGLKKSLLPLFIEPVNFGGAEASVQQKQTKGGKSGPSVYKPGSNTKPNYVALNNPNYVKALLAGDKETANFELDKGQRNDPHIQEGTLEERRMSNFEASQLVRERYKCQKHPQHLCYIPPLGFPHYGEHVKIDVGTLDTYVNFVRANPGIDVTDKRDPPPPGIRRILEKKHKDFMETRGAMGENIPEQLPQQAQAAQPAVTRQVAPTRITTRPTLELDYVLYPSMISVINELQDKKPRDGYENLITPIVCDMKVSTIAELLYILYETVDANIQNGTRGLPLTPFAVLSSMVQDSGGQIAPVMSGALVRACEAAARSFEE